VSIRRVTYPAVTALIQSYLATALADGTPIEKLVPDPRPDRFVLLALAPAHGGDELVLSSRSLIVQAWDKPQSAAEQLAEDCFAILRAARYDKSESVIRNVERSTSPYWFPDPDIGSAHPRYQFVMSVLLRGTVS
jgi:hypothetical protein